MRSIAGRGGNRAADCFSYGNAPDDVDRIIALFELIAQQEGWQPGDQLRAHRDASVDFGVSVEGELAGGMQVVLPDEAGRFPFHTVWSEAAVEAPCRTAHVAVLAVRSELRGNLRLFWPLCVELWRFCVARGIETLVLEATPAMRARYCHLGWPLQQIGEMRSHWGEPCVLTAMNVQAVGGAMLTRAVRSPAFRTLIMEAMRPLVERRNRTLNNCVPTSPMAL